MVERAADTERGRKSISGHGEPGPLLGLTRMQGGEGETQQNYRGCEKYVVGRSQSWESRGRECSVLTRMEPTPHELPRCPRNGH